MNRFNNNGKTAWSGHRPDTFAKGASRRPNFNIRRNEVFQRQPIEDDELEGRPHGDSHHDDTVSGKLDRLLDKMDKFDLWRDEADRRFENLDPCLSRKTEPPLGFDDGDDGVCDDVRRGRSGDGGYRSKNADWGVRDTALEDRGRRGARDGGGSGWDFHGNRGGRAQFGGYPQQFDKPTSCWDPPHHYKASAAGFAKNQVTMKPPRFDGSEATNWISRVQYYFDHLMIPDAQRLHYAVMLFDPPASEWVFYYGANIECVTWQEFLEDVRHSFDRQRDRYRREGRIHMGSCWDPPRYQQHRQPIGGHDQPPLGPPSRWDPPDYSCPQTLQPTRSGRPLGHRTAPCPAQLAAVGDYNEKLRVYRVEDWWYEDGEDETKGVYIAKLDELQKQVDPIEERFKEHSERGTVINQLIYCINSDREAARSNDYKYDHIDLAEKQKVLSDCVEAEAGLREKQQHQDTLPKSCSPIMMKPQPAAKPSTPEPVPTERGMEVVSDEEDDEDKMWEEEQVRKGLEKWSDDGVGISGMHHPTQNVDGRSCYNNVGGASFDMFGRDVNLRKWMDITRRSEARRVKADSKRKLAMERASSVQLIEGKFSTDESDSETSAHESTHTQLLQVAAVVKGQFEKWKKNCATSYRDAYMSFSSEGRRSAIRFAFDPGGNRSRQAYIIRNSLPCFVVSP